MQNKLQLRMASKVVPHIAENRRMGGKKGGRRGGNTGAGSESKNKPRNE